MRTTAAWAFRRQLQYLIFFSVVLIGIFTLVYFQYIYSPSTCFDETQNGFELGVDCGGECIRICPFELREPTVDWARSFRVTEGVYNAVGYVENSNRGAASPELKYTFSIYDDDGLITERSGVSVLPPGGKFPIFEGRITTGERVPTRTFLEIEPPELWQPISVGNEQFSVLKRELFSVDKLPKIKATLKNNNLTEVAKAEVVATIFDTSSNALAVSKTVIENFGARSEKEVVFTWPEPIATVMRSCEIPTDVLLAIDLSGSMNNDGGDPPEPISSVKASADAFVARLGAQDQVGVVTFASLGKLELPLSTNSGAAQLAVMSLSIDPEEETGNTNTGEAITKATQELVSDRHNENARKVMVLLTDGLATAPEEDPELFAIEAASVAKQEGIELFAIGLGEGVNMEFVRQLATTEDYAHQAVTKEDVDKIYRSITSAMCEDGVAVIDIVVKSESGFVPIE